MKRTNGEGTIFKRADGRWCGAFYDENYKRRYVYGRTKKEVTKKLKEKMEFPNRAQYDGVDFKNLETWMEYYLENYKKNEIKETTYATYYELNRKHIKGSKIGKLKMETLNANQLQVYYNQKYQEGYNPKSIKHIYTLLNSGLNKAVQLKMIRENVNKMVTLPKREAYRAKVLTAEEVRRIVNEAKAEELYPIVALTLYSGLRKGEVMGLTWENINFEEAELYVEASLCRVVETRAVDGKTKYTYKLLEPKTAKSRRTVPLLPVALEALKLQKERQDAEKERNAVIYQDQGFVFARYDGRYLEQRSFIDSYYAFLEKYGITKVRFHDLRHSFASLLLEAGESPKAIQELLGHSTITTTMDIYSHITKKGKVAALEKLSMLIENEED